MNPHQIYPYEALGRTKNANDKTMPFEIKMLIMNTCLSPMYRNGGFTYNLCLKAHLEILIKYMLQYNCWMTMISMKIMKIFSCDQIVNFTKWLNLKMSLWESLQYATLWLGYLHKVATSYWGLFTLFSCIKIVEP